MIFQHKYWLAEFSSQGGELIRLYDKQRQIDILYKKDATLWNRVAPHLFPIIGGLAQKGYWLDHQFYGMSNHGFLRDSQLELIEVGKDHVLFNLSSNDQTKQIYPFDFSFDLLYTFTHSKVKVDYTIHNTGQDRMYYMVGAHPGFNVNFDEKPTLTLIGDHIEEYVMIDNKIADIREQSQHELILDDSFFSQDTFLYKGVDKVKLQFNDYQLSMKWNDDLNVALWTPRYKETNELGHCLCIEPWYGLSEAHSNNGQLALRKGIKILNPDETKHISYTIKIK